MPDHVTANNVEDGVYQAFFDFVKAALPNEVPYLRDSNFCAPSGPYSTIKLAEVQPISWTRGELVAPDGVTGLEESYSIYKGVVQLSFYGEKAFSRAQVVAACLQQRQMKQLLRDNSLGYQRHTPVRDASRGIDRERIEQGATLSISFFFQQGGIDRGDDAGVIEQATASSDESTTYTNWPPATP